MKRALFIIGMLIAATAIARNPRGGISGVAPVTTGVWTNVTPSGVNLSTGVGSCGNFGTETVMPDTQNPGTYYTEFNCVGIYKSTDYGVTWTGPVNTGTNGTTISNCQGGISVNPSATGGGTPTLYESCIQGLADGFNISTDGGVNWTQVNISVLASRQDVYPPQVDPYNRNHLLMAGHEQNVIVESTDGGTTWAIVPVNSGMNQAGGTAAIFFVNTGVSGTTATTFLWMGQQAGGAYGTWRTTNDGTAWTQVDLGEHGHGTEQIFQPNTTGTLYIPQAYSSLGWGILRSTDYGQTFTHVGATNNLTNVWGTSSFVYGMLGFPVGAGGCNTPAFEVAAQPGTGTYTQTATPGGMCQGSGWIATGNTGGHNVFVGAMWNNGLWRYVE